MARIPVRISFLADTAFAKPELYEALGYRQAGAQVGFAGTTIADEDDRFGPFDVCALREFVDLHRRDFGALREVEILQGLQSRQTCFAQAPLDQIALTFFPLGGEQRFEKAQMGTAVTHSFGGVRDGEIAPARDRQLLSAYQKRG